MNQLSLPLTLDSKMLLSNFVAGDNKLTVEFLLRLFQQKHSSIVYIYGPRSSGKTHLLQGCAFKALDSEKDVVYIDLSQEIPEGFLDGLESNDWVCIDNIEHLTKSQQHSLFSLYNLAINTGLKLIISGSVLPNELILIKDLKTRLSLATIFTLQYPNDDIKRTIIMRQVEERNLRIDTNIYDYLFKYYSRDLEGLLSLIDRLDKASLQKKNNITIPLVKQVLKA
jgi:DnaA family protein